MTTPADAAPDRPPAVRGLPADVRAALGRAASHLLVPLLADILGQSPYDRDEEAHAVMALAAVHLLPPSCVDDVVASAAASVTMLESMHRHGGSSDAETRSAVRAVARALPPATRARLAERGWVMALAGDDPICLSGPPGTG